jgi:OPA family glycerol-3-phosphate transporter-like MFS transporter
MSLIAPSHSRAFRARRFANWFPLGLAYAFLSLGRYNLNVAQGALGRLMTPEDFGIIFGIGTLVYGLAFLVNGPLTDKLGGRWSMLVSLVGSAAANLAMGLYVRSVDASGSINNTDLRLWLSVLNALNMYFQSFGAVAIVKVNASWFHVRERGSFGGIFGTMISAGIFLAYTVNHWVLDAAKQLAPASSDVARSVWVFYVPAVLLAAVLLFEMAMLRDRPSQAGHADFDTGDASSGEGEEVSFKQVFLRVVTNPIILTVALIEFCTGVVRHGIMQSFPIFADQVLALPSSHPLVAAHPDWMRVLWFALAASGFFALAALAKGKRRGWLLTSGALVALTPFVSAGWGGLLFVAGVIGGNVAGYVSDLFFQSRRAPAAGGLYGLLFLCTVGMAFALGKTEPVIAESRTPELKAGDRILGVNGKGNLQDWHAVREAFGSVPARCLGGSRWDVAHSMCSSSPSVNGEALAPSSGFIPVEIERGGVRMTIPLKDERASMRAGDQRKLQATPVSSLSPYWLGVLAFIMSLCVIGTHGLLSGSATMDFGGRKGAATATGLIDGFVYLGTTVQSVALGYLTNRSWTWWPIFLMPFTAVGFLLCLRIWNARPAALVVPAPAPAAAADALPRTGT